MAIAPNGKHCCRVVLTGGPGGGKTTALDLFRRELGEKIVIVPEAATLLYAGGFPRVNEAKARKATQTAIYHVQRGLEDVQSAQFHDRVLLCDRGTVDGAIYWPGPTEEFFDHLGSSLDKELARYDAVIFFETAAVGGQGIEGGNPVRVESSNEAIDLDRRLREIWSKHPHFYMVPNNISFFRKITTGFAILESVVSQLVAKKEAMSKKT